MESGFRLATPNRSNRVMSLSQMPSGRRLDEGASWKSTKKRIDEKIGGVRAVSEE